MSDQQQVSEPQRIIVPERQGVAQSEAFRRRRVEIEQEVRAAFAMQLAEAGLLGSWILRRRMRSEVERRVRQELDRMAPPGAHY